MADFYEIDFLNLDTTKSGDAITIRHNLEGTETTYIVDAGYQSCGDKVISHIEEHYSANKIDHVVATHADGDHAGGLRKILEEKDVGTLWMNRPWLYADVLIDEFSKFSNVENLKKRLKEIYPNLHELEKIANDNGIEIKEAFQGQKIGAFTVVSPTKDNFLSLIIDSEKTPESVKKSEFFDDARNFIKEAFAKVRKLIAAVWGDENFSSEQTSAENRMSIVQYAELCGDKILLTGDAGRDELQVFVDYAPTINVSLPGINVFQVPHHGSRRNLSSDILDSILGPKKNKPVTEGEHTFRAFICAANDDERFPKKVSIRAMYHRGGKVYTTEKSSWHTGKNKPDRDGWSSSTGVDYPEEQEV